MNNVSEITLGDEFSRKGGITCFNCEDCYYYGHETDATDNYKAQCFFYIKSDRAIANEKQIIENRATNQRELFKVIKGGK